MKNKLILLAALILSSCGEPDTAYVNICTCAQNEKVMYFVERTTGDANNRSDEEMEDVIAELWLVGVRTNCPKRLIGWDYGGGKPTERLDSCETAYKLQ